MAKASGSAPDPPAESEDSGEEEATTEEDAEENGGSGSESDTESEQESKLPSKSQPTKKPPSNPAPAVKKPETPKPPSPNTSSDDDSGSDSESDSPEIKPDPNIKPIASKPVETTAEKKSRSKAKANSSLTKTSSAAGTKRPATSETAVDGEVKETKRVKKKPEKYVEEFDKKVSSNDDSRKLFQRLWSEDDEIAILKGMIDYSAKKKADPVANLDAFHEFIKKSLHVDVSRTQLQDKIRRLRKKYVNNADKEKNGKERIFAKDHEHKSFELSKKVWGNENSTALKKLESSKYNGEVVSTSRGKNTNIKKPLNEIKEDGDKEGMILISEKTGLEEGLKSVKLGLRNLGIEEWIMENSQFVDEEKRAKMDEKWKNFKTVEAEFYAKKLELMLEETKMISDALKSSAS